jgi:glyoxylate utilization-related uncharacterized protein
MPPLYNLSRYVVDLRPNGEYENRQADVEKKRVLFIAERSASLVLRGPEGMMMVADPYPGIIVKKA